METQREEWSMDIGKASFYAMFLIIPILILFFIPFVIIWGFNLVWKGFRELSITMWLYVIAGIILHELLHGLTWAIFAKKGIKSIKFGVNWQYITPYCHCKEPLKVRPYIAGAAMPLIILGIIPAIISIIYGDGGWLLFGIFFTWAAGGDMIAINALRKLDKSLMVSDHPEKLGFFIEKNN